MDRPTAARGRGWELRGHLPEPFERAGRAPPGLAAIPRVLGRLVLAPQGDVVGSDLGKFSEVYRDAPGMVSMAGLPARHAPGRVVAVEGGIEARLGASSIAGSTDAYYDRRPRPAAPDHARRPPRRRRA